MWGGPDPDAPEERPKERVMSHDELSKRTWSGQITANKSRKEKKKL